MSPRGALAAAIALALAALPVGGAALGAAVERTIRADALLVRLELDRASLLVDERVLLDLTIEAPAGLAVELLELEPVPGGLVPVDRRREELPGGLPDRQIRRERILLEPTGTGTLALPPLRLELRAPGAATRRLELEPLAVEVRSVLPPGPAPIAPRELPPPVDLPAPGGSLGPWLAAGLAFLIVGLALVLRRRRPRRARSDAAAAPEPEALALALLDRLEADDRAGRAGPGEPHVRLASILRDYVRGRLGLDAPRLTTEELGLRLPALGAHLAEPSRRVGALLAACDLVKFARHRPSPAALRDDLTSARALIRETARR